MQKLESHGHKNHVKRKDEQWHWVEVKIAAKTLMDFERGRKRWNIGPIMLLFPANPLDQISRSLICLEISVEII